MWKGILFYSPESPVPHESTFSEELTVSPESKNSSASIESLNSPNLPEKWGSPASFELSVSQESLISIYSPESPGSPESQDLPDLPESSESQFHQFNQNRQFK